MREGAEKQAADIGKNSGAARGDAVLGQKLIETVKGVVDALSSLEAMIIAREMSVVVGGLGDFLLGAMLGAEAGMGIGSKETALTAVGSVIETAEGCG